MITRVEVALAQRLPDPRGEGLLQDAAGLGITGLTSIRTADLFFLQGELSTHDLYRLCTELLSDPVTQVVHWRPLDSAPEQAASDPEDAWIVEVGLLPGVTDPVADQIRYGARLLGITGLERAATGQRYVIRGDLSEADVHRLAQRLLCNPVIQHYRLGLLHPHFPQPAAARPDVECIDLSGLDEDELLALSRQRLLSLDAAEMCAIRDHFAALGRPPTDVELETLAQTWSEHCVHKTFKALITVEPNPPAPFPCREGGELPSPRRGGAGGEVIDGLLRTYIRAATEQVAKPWVRSAFVDNAGIIDFDDEYEVSFKVETHNHPSALEPFGGANTGVGGVVRDILGVSARPIATTDVLCFGPQDLRFDDLPEGTLHPRRVMNGVVAGIQDYGNKLGLPTVNGAILFDPGYTANPLVYCGCVGIAPKGRHPRRASPGDRIVVIGGRTGRDGLHGATFSSTALTHETGAIAGSAVQIGDPITEKGILEVVVAARDQGLYTAITDCGAGGLSSAIGEMAGRMGAEVQLEDVPLKYPGLAPWEIWLSEAQERMVLAVPPRNLPALRDLCARFGVELRDLGQFTDSGRLIVRYGSQVVADLDLDFLHGGLPRRRMRAVMSTQGSPEFLQVPADSYEQLLLALLSHPDIASKEAVIRRYDHEVQAGTVVKPLTGRWNDGPSDAAVLKPLEARGWRGLALACGINPQYGKLDPYRMAVSAIDEAIRNAVAVGADPDRIALLDNFCWGNPNRPERLGELVRAAQGCYDAAVAYGTPFISGKDSLNNEYLGPDGQPHSIPGTLLISALGIVPDVRCCVTSDLKAPGDLLYVLGETRAELGGSHAYLVQGIARGVPPGLPPAGPATVRALAQAIQAGLVQACHDCAEGGLAVAAAEMAIAGGTGLRLALEGIPHTPDAAWAYTLLFSESNGRFIVEVRPEDAQVFEALLAGVPYGRAGLVLEAPQVEMTWRDEAVVQAEVQALRKTWQCGLTF